MKLRTLPMLLLLAGMLIACGDEAGNAPAVTTGDAATVGSETTAVTEDNRPDSGLEDKDFGGAVYRITTYDEDDYKSLYAESTDGEAVNDAIFARNTYLEETYNFTFDVQCTNEHFGDHTDSIRKVVLAGEDAYDLVYGHVVTTCNNAIAGVYLDLYDVPHLDFDQPWWPAQSVEQMTVNDKMFTICSGINYRQLAAAKVLFLNKKLINQYDLELPYQWVKDGTWTFDRLMETCRDLYVDSNGNGERDWQDTWGFTTIAVQNGFQTAFNAQVLTKTEDGLEISVMSDKMVDIIDRLYSWYYESGDVYPTPHDTEKEDYLQNVFSGGHAVYAFGNIHHATSTYRDSDISYGIVPMPKYDEQQDSYYVFACPQLFSIPITCVDTDFAGFVFEAMTYYGYYDIIPTYYELTLQGKIADSPEDVEMLEIINDHLTVSFAYCYDDWEGFAHLLGKMGFSATGGSKDLASVAAKGEKKAQKRLDKIIEGFFGE